MSKFDETLLASLLTLKQSPNGSLTAAVNRLSVDLSISPATLKRALNGLISDKTSAKLVEQFRGLNANEKARVNQAFSVLERKHGRGARLSTLNNVYKNSLKWNRTLAKEREKFNIKRRKAEKKGSDFALKNLSILGSIS